MNIVIYFYANGRHRCYMFLSYLDIQLESKKYFYSGKYVCYAGTSSSFFFLKSWSKQHDLPMQHLVSWLLWYPTMVTIGFFSPFLQSAKPDSWKEKLSSNAFARKVISKYIVQGLKCTSREILTIVWRFITPFFFAFAVASIFTNCGRSSPLSVWWNGPKFSLQMVGEVDH